MARITINGVSLDPIKSAQALNLAGLEFENASASDYILVQTTAPLLPDQAAELARLSVVVQEYVSENTYLCGYKGTDLKSIRSLAFVSWANVYLRGFKVPPNLRPQGGDPASYILPQPNGMSHSRTTRTVDIIFHDGVDTGSDALRTAVAAAARVDKDTLPIGRGKVRLAVQEKYLDDLAAIDMVRVIQTVPEVKLRNNVARPILNANVVVGAITYQGDGQVVAVADTGFDNGSTTNPHPAFTGRVARLYALGRATKADDPDGHGTHVCGSVLGDGSSTSMGGVIQGVAPRAQLVVQSLVGSTGQLSGIPTDLTDLFEPPYRDDGARVHTNSWGDVTPGQPYNSMSREIDQFVWDHPDLVICFAAGNDGTDGNGDGSIDPAQVGSESAAKNCITVGASESVRREIQADFPTYGSLRPSDFPKPPIHDDQFANNAEGMAAFSSRGPTQERRFKPDVVAPGTSILSTHSRHAPAAKNTFGKSSDSDYFFDTGTSMATPLVAGCAAVLRQTLVMNGMPTPPAALIKALLINGAVELVGQYSPSEAGPSPNNNSGFGRVNLLGSVILPGPNPDAGLGDGGPLKQGEEFTITVDIPREIPKNKKVSKSAPASVGAKGLGVTFKITLVWSDPAGPDLQNDLDLIVKAADGSERHGNMGTSSGFDRLNNVEQVQWPNMPPGKATIIIRATRITRFPQPYAYAWRIS
ncbi:S8 family serine peptidase [Pseudomonas izuensis]|uniref:S8 family serine peptidase n=1 Tax=Pseudomonas izuensis TaxID=2684212 RepID=UPI00135C9135|nr:S8 family serine peptidase [Pseudomonas izuensis]